MRVTSTRSGENPLGQLREFLHLRSRTRSQAMERMSIDDLHDDPSLATTGETHGWPCRPRQSSFGS